MTDPEYSRFLKRAEGAGKGPNAYFKAIVLAAIAPGAILVERKRPPTEEGDWTAGQQ